MHFSANVAGITTGIVGRHYRATARLQLEPLPLERLPLGNVGVEAGVPINIVLARSITWGRLSLLHSGLCSLRRIATSEATSGRTQQQWATPWSGPKLPHHSCIFRGAAEGAQREKGTKRRGEILGVWVLAAPARLWVKSN